jgi:WD40 repeat protein
LIIKVWDMQNGTELRSLRGHTDWISSVAFGADSRFIVSASVDKTVKIWELSNDETTAPAGHTRRLNALAVSPNGKLLASGSDDHTIKIWDMEGGQELMTLAEYTGSVTALIFDPSGERLISGGTDKKILIWSIREKKLLQTIEADPDVQIPALAYDAKRDRLFAWFFRSRKFPPMASSIVEFDKVGKRINALTEREKVILCAVFSANCDWIAMGADDGSVRIWDLKTNERIGGEMPVHEKDVSDLLFTPDKKLLITCDVGGEVKIWNLAKKESIKMFQAHKPEAKPNDSAIQAAESVILAMSPDGKRFVTAKNNELRLWSVEKGEKMGEWDLSTPISAVTFSPDGKKLITANGDATLYLIELPD